MSLGKAIAEAIAGGIAGYATVETGTDFINPLLSGQQAAQDRKARKDEIKFKAEVDKQTALELAEKRGAIEADTAKAIAKIRGDQEAATARDVANIRVSSAEQIAKFEAGIRSEEAEKTRGFQREESTKGREFTLKRDERLQAAKAAEAELDRAHSAYLADQSAENQKALQDARFTHDKAMSALDVAAREKAVQQAQSFQAEESEKGRQFQAQMELAQETGDFSGVLKILPKAQSLVEDLTNRVQVATRAVMARDQRQADLHRENLAAKSDVAKGLAATSPNEFLEKVPVMREAVQQMQGKVQGDLVLDSTKTNAAERTAALLQSLNALERQAQEASLGMAVEAGEYKALADENIKPETRRSVINRRYGQDTVPQKTYDVATSLVGQLEVMSYAGLDDIQDPRVRELVSLLQGDGETNALASLSEQLGRNLKDAPTLAAMMDGVQIGDVQAAMTQVQRTETKMDFNERVREATTGAGEQLDLNLELPETAFMLSEDGQMTLTAKGASELATAFEGATSSMENPTLGALEAVDQVAARSGWDEGTTAGVKRAIAQDYEFIEDLALTYENPAETIGGQISADFRVLSPQVVAEIRDQTAGMGDSQAKAWLSKRGFNPAHLELVREGGSVHGREVVRSVLPDSRAAGKLMEEIQSEMTIALAAGDDDVQSKLQAEFDLLQSVGADPSVTLMAEHTMFDATQAVAHGDLEAFYDKITEKAAASGGFDLALEGEEDKQKADFIAYVEQGATEGARVRRALERLSSMGAFQLGQRQQATSEGQQQFNSFIAAYADDYGERLDDVIASIDLGALIYRGRKGFLNMSPDRELNPSRVALGYLTSTADELEMFRQENAAERDFQRIRGRDLNK